MRFQSEQGRLTNKERNYGQKMEEYIASSPFSQVEKFENFAKYTSRQTLTRFLCKHELFKKILNISGSIVECGVAIGGGLMSWAQFSAIYESTHYIRKVIGFDTFEGFPELSKEDSTSTSTECHEGGLRADSYDDLKTAIELFDQNRPIGHIPKVELVRGDARHTIPEYLEKNPYLVVSLLYLDFDIYEPTVTALEHFLPRMPKGAILGFDELNDPRWPGETLAVLEKVGLRNLKIERFYFESCISYAVLD